MIAPMLASPLPGDVESRTNSSTWVAEQKLDGNRVMVVGPGSSSPAYLTRGGVNYSKSIPTAVRKFRLPGINTANVVFDTEVVGDAMWVFDMLGADGGFNHQPLSFRRAVLEQFFSPDAPHNPLAAPDCPFKLVPQATTTAQKTALVLRAREESLEGVMFKRADSKYSFGHRSNDWLKLKFVQTADVIIMAVRDDGKESAKLGIAQGLNVTEVGRCSLIGKPAVQVGDVVEVRYLYVPDRNKPRLYQPTLIKVRRDKKPHECDGSDFKYTDKKVLATL